MRCVELLRNQGVWPKRARVLAFTADPALIEAWVEAWPFVEPRPERPAPFLATAIANGAPIPERFLARKAWEARKAAEPDSVPPTAPASSEPEKTDTEAAVVATDERRGALPAHLRRALDVVHPAAPSGRERLALTDERRAALGFAVSA